MYKIIGKQFQAIQKGIEGELKVNWYHKLQR